MKITTQLLIKLSFIPILFVMLNSYADSSLGESISIKLIDHEMLNTQREKVKLVEDVMADKLVIMNFVYTDCKTVCPVSTHIMSEVFKSIQSDENIKNKVELRRLTKTFKHLFLRYRIPIMKRCTRYNIM